MTHQSNTWALVLAAGEGSRLRSLTTTVSGSVVPKQFCSLFEGPSLLHQALCRGSTVAALENTCVVVAERHRRWWEGPLWSLPPRNVIVQAENRGTGLGILLSLLHIMARDPGARVVLLPSDHHVRYEALLSEALGRAIQEVQGDPERTVLLGMQPEDLDPDLGYLVPTAANGHEVLRIERFVEKPALAVASELVRAGALWNTFIVVASAEALLGLFRARFPEIVSVMSAAFDTDFREGAEGFAMAELYESLPVVDFSRDILAEQVGQLRVLPVRPCGWSDLGTPRRVSAALREGTRSTEESWVGSCTGYISLAAQHERLGAPV